MSIIDQVTELQRKTREYGNYRRVSELSGVNYHWLQQFAIGRITNPTISNVSKLEQFFLHQVADCSR